MKKASLFLILIAVCILSLIAGFGLGSVRIAPLESLNIIINRIFGTAPFGAVNQTTETILLRIRLPRVLLAFISGSGLAISGVMMQSVLKNPLASSFTLGVSSGAALGASVAILFNIAVFGFFTLPIFGLFAGLLTVFLALSVTAKVDKSLQNNSIILTGMAFSLFASAGLTIIMAFSGESINSLIFWQMGSFSRRTSTHVYALLPIVIIGFLIILKFTKAMDVMTLGDEQAKTTGVEVRKMKILLLSLSAIITGSVVAMVGIIGFVDLFTPHIARKMFGSKHRYVIPASALLGGAFMVICDLAARTLLPPIELPVGAITAAIGAPFFMYLYFSGRKRSKK
ncbi:MAG: iron ABC transporter permease [Defluviitaleaceae bacterium]|nr:iron ABC transporter permease [Defluviitaleaceae bacterium]